MDKLEPLQEFTNIYLSTGFKVYRLKETQESSEFLLYESRTEKYYQYSMKRGYDILKQMVEKIYLKNTLRSTCLSLGLVHEDSKTSNKDVNDIFRYIVNENLLFLDNISYKPCDDLIISENGKDYFNTYRKTIILSQYNLHVTQNGFPTIRKIILNLVDNDEESYIYLISWLAFQINNPNKRLVTSIIFQGEHGTGKTLFCTHILKEIFGSNYIEIGQSDINKEFNDFIYGKQIIVANEVIQGTNMNTSEKLKNYVADSNVSINRKFKDSLNITNYSHWIFITNNQIPLRLERGDRRYTVFKSRKLENGFETYNSMIVNKREELSNFLNYITSLTVNFNDVNKPFFTTAKKDLLDASLNSIESFIEQINESGSISNLINEMKTSNTYISDYISINTIDKGDSQYIRLDQLYSLYMEYCKSAGIKNKYGRNGFTSMLKHLNFHLTVIRDIDERSFRVIKSEGCIK